MEALTFVCARCRYRVLSGFEPWEDCRDCSQVRTALKDALPYVPDYRILWRTPKVTELRETIRIKPAWSKPQVWWPMRDHPQENMPILGSPDYTWHSGHGDTIQEDFECFNDSTYSPEYRAKLREQMALEIFSMPDDEWMMLRRFGRTRGPARKS